MQLRQYALRNLSVPLLLILTCWALGFYMTITNEINEETDESLSNHKTQIVKAISSDTTLLVDHVDILTQYYVKEIDKAQYDPRKEHFFDTKMIVEDGDDGKEIPQRGPLL